MAEARPTASSGDDEERLARLDRWFTWGMSSAVALSGLCLVASVGYLFYFLAEISGSLTQLIQQGMEQKLPPKLIEVGINANIPIARLALLSCAVFVGMAFGFLGFALFLLGVKGEMNVAASNERFQVKLARISPGVFVILVSAILIGMAATTPIKFVYTREEIPASQSRLPPAPSKTSPATQGDSGIGDIERRLLDAEPPPAQPEERP